MSVILSRVTTTLLAASARSVMRQGHAGMVTVSDAFDSGNILLASLRPSNDGKVKLRIKPDPYTELEGKRHMQWFAFRATNDEAATVTYEIENAGDCSFAVAWKGAEVMASTDREEWRRVASTRYDEERGVLSWDYTHDASTPSVYFAYFDTYSYERHLSLVASCAAAKNAPGLRVHSLGQTLDGRELDCVTVGTGALQAWVIHRQHPGESMASFFAEGLLGRLLGLKTGSSVDALTAKLLKQFTFHIVPSMNPDGALRGHLRVNAGGANLNREWASTGEYTAPTLERSPEVYHVLAAMDETGVDVSSAQTQAHRSNPTSLRPETCACWVC